MRAGTLDRRVVLRAMGTTQDAVGQPVPAWTDGPPLWANIKYATGAESIKAGAETSIAKASIRIRYTASVNASMRVFAQDDSTVFEIKAVLPSRRKGFTDLVCEVVL